MTDTPPDWSEPLRRLGEGLTGWLADLPVGPAEPTDAPAGAAPPSSCRGCPVCAVLAVLRGQRPEVTDALADVLTSAAVALRAFTTPREPAPAEQPAERPVPPMVQRIDVA